MKISEIPTSATAGHLQPLIMGILNVTSDSFFDGGKYLNISSAFKRATEMEEEGADIIDVGGESTRPGSFSISKDEEIERVVSVIEKISAEIDVQISCDTSKSEVAEAALKAGAVLINDVNGFRDSMMIKTALKYGAAICIMHMKGCPFNMQVHPVYDDILCEIKDFLFKQAKLCEKSGIVRENIIIDPGIGFGKTVEDNIKILANIKYFGDEYSLLVGASRKSFLGAILDNSVKERLAGSIAVSCYLTLKGVQILRVHDVKETKDAIKIIQKLSNND